MYRITGAQQSLSDDVSARQRRYVISMLIRTVAVIGTVVLWDISKPAAFFCLVLGTLIPYVAVVIANGGRGKPVPLPTAQLGTPLRPQLPGPDHPEGSRS